MRINKTISILFLILSSYSMPGQTKKFIINDIFYPELRGHVKSFTESIIAQNDTLRIIRNEYSKAGIRIFEASRSKHTEIGFTNDTFCFEPVGKFFYSVDCVTRKGKSESMEVGADGLIAEVYHKYPKVLITFMPNYNLAGQVKILYTSKTDSIGFQFFATLSYEHNEDSTIKTTWAEGGDEPQGKTEYTYDKNKNLIQTIRTLQHGDGRTFTIDYSNHDQEGNWTSARYQNGIIIKREFTYYNN